MHRNIRLAIIAILLFLVWRGVWMATPLLLTLGAVALEFSPIWDD